METKSNRLYFHAGDDGHLVVFPRDNGVTLEILPDFPPVLLHISEMDHRWVGTSLLRWKL